MALLVTATSAADAYVKMRSLLFKHGENVAPRDLKTLELRNVTITVTDLNATLMVDCGRKLNTRLAALEALQLVGGFSDPGLMRALAPATAEFLDGGAFHGAYGPRLRPQLPRVVERLNVEHTTRRAVATVWDPALDTYYDDSRDYPCTTVLTWHIRGGKLHQTTHMRSNDLHMGWPYDVFQFTVLQHSLANALGVPAGEYTHVVDSLHLYDRDFDAASRVELRDAGDHRPHVSGIGNHLFTRIPAVAWSIIRRRAHDLTYNADFLRFRQGEAMEKYLHERVHP